MARLVAESRPDRDLDRRSVRADGVHASEVAAVDTAWQRGHEQLSVGADFNVGGYRFGDVRDADHARRQPVRRGKRSGDLLWLGRQHAQHRDVSPAASTFSTSLPPASATANAP